MSRHIWKTIFGGRQHLVEDDLWWKMTFGGRQPAVEDNLHWKKSFGENHLRWKTTFSGRQPSVDPCMLPTLLCSIFSICLTHLSPKMAPKVGQFWEIWLMHHLCYLFSRFLLKFGKRPLYHLVEQPFRDNLLPRFNKTIFVKSQKNCTGYLYYQNVKR